jgi:hypothetical protein
MNDDAQERRRKELRSRVAMLRIDSAALMERVERDLRELKMLELRRRASEWAAKNQERRRQGLPPLTFPDKAKRVNERARAILRGKR